MMLTATAPFQGYSQGEVLANRMTAKEWTKRFEPAVLEVTDDRETCLREIAMHGDQEAQRLNLPLSTTGHYPPFVWELVALRNR